MIARRLLLTGLLLVATAGCTAAFDADGDLMMAGPMAAPAPKQLGAVPIVVDTDLAPDDLAALTYLLRHPRVSVVAVTVPTTGMVTCEGGLDLLADLFEQIDLVPVPVACGAAHRGAEGVPFPAAWTVGSLTHSGLERAVGGHLDPVPGAASDYVARLADRIEGLQVVALGPLTEIAALERRHRDSYARLDAVTTMAGIVDGTSHDPDLGVGEWNAGADPAAFARVLAGPVPVTVLPDDPVPPGPPAGMAAPIVGHFGVATPFPSPAFWDLATAGVFTTPGAATTESGAWSVDTNGDRGRLVRTGPGRVRVVRTLDPDRLNAAYAAVFR